MHTPPALRRIARLGVALAIALVTGCSEPGDGAAGGEQAVRSAPRANASVADADAVGTGAVALGPNDVARGRYDEGWRAFAERDREGRAASLSGRDTGPAGEAVASAEADTGPAAGGEPAVHESWDDIGRGALVVDRAALPLEGKAEGPSVLAAQVLLDRARFSPGVADGYWGKNVEKAVYWFQSERGVEPTGTLDRATLDLLRGEARASRPLSREIRLDEELASGSFVTLPESVYERADMECLCYESLGEKLAERFHTTRDVLSALNPGVDLDALKADDPLVVLDHGGPVDSLGARERPSAGPVERIVVSAGGHYVHALDGRGRILYHFPSTLGSTYAPSPRGEYAIDAIAFQPTWHYQPDLLTGEDDSREDAILPPGPNNPVGVVWMDLSKPHYGIHGTAAPSTIGYVTSHGCVRLTNWDAAFLARRAGVEAGTPVEFRGALSLARPR